MGSDSAGRDWSWMNRAVLNGQAEDLRAIAERDKHTVARLGQPETDPLLRAEMDRRILLGRIESVELLCTFWDRISKGETSTTRQIRSALNGDT